MKKVRITLELSNSFIGLLHASCEIKGLTAIAAGTSEADRRAGPDVVGVLAISVLGEARGMKPLQIHAAIPPEWRPDIEVIHDERRVYDDGQLVGSGA